MIHEDEIHLDEDEDHLQERPHQNDDLVAVGVGSTEAGLEEDADLDPGVDQTAHSEY